MTIINFKKLTKDNNKKKRTIKNKFLSKKGGSNFIKQLVSNNLSHKSNNDSYASLFKNNDDNDYQINEFNNWYTNNPNFKKNNWIPISKDLYSNFFFNNYKTCKYNLNNYLLNSFYNYNSDLDIIWPDDLHTNILKIGDYQSFVPYFVEYNINNNDIFENNYNSWINKNILAYKIYEQLLYQVKNKYIIKLRYNICNSKIINESGIKLYFNNSYINNFSYDHNVLCNQILNSTIFFNLFPRNLPNDSESYENLLNKNKNLLDIYFPIISSIKELEEVEKKKGLKYKFLEQSKELLKDFDKFTKKQSEDKNGDELINFIINQTESSIDSLIKKQESEIESQNLFIKNKEKEDSKFNPGFFKDFLKKKDDILLQDIDTNIGNDDSKKKEYSGIINYFQDKINPKNLIKLFSSKNTKLNSILQSILLKDKDILNKIIENYNSIYYKQYFSLLNQKINDFESSDGLDKKQITELYNNIMTKENLKKVFKEFNCNEKGNLNSYIECQIGFNRFLDELIEKILLNDETKLTSDNTDETNKTGIIYSKNYFQNVFLLNEENLNIVKKKYYLDIKENIDDQKKKIFKDFNHDYYEQIISKSQLNLNKILLNNDYINLDGDLLILIPVGDNIYDLKNIKIDDNLVKIQDGLYLNNGDINKCQNLIFGNIPIIFISIPIKTIINNQNKYIPYVKHINFNEKINISFPNEMFKRFELISLIRLLINNKLIIKNNFINNISQNPSNMISKLKSINRFINNRINNFKIFIVNYQNDESMVKIKDYLNTYLNDLQQTVIDNENKIKYYQSWDLIL